MTMTITRRQLLGASGAAVGLHVLAPVVVRAGAAFGQTGPHPSTRTRNRLVVVFLEGGNDGLNMVVPRGDVRGEPRYSVYRKVRPSIAYAPDEVLPLDRPTDRAHLLGLNAELPTLHKLYRSGRVAVVQGVDYPDHDYSHFTSTDIWQSGEPGMSPSSGWLGRHLDREGIGEGELRGVGIGNDLPLILRGRKRQGIGVASIGTTLFSDGTGDAADPAHAAFAAFGRHPATEPLRHYAGRQAAVTIDVVNTLAHAPRPPETGVRVADALLTARVMLEQNLGAECLFLTTSGFDTHTGQRQLQESLFRDFDAGLQAFYDGTVNGTPTGLGPLRKEVADRTIIMVVSEFGRRIGENGSGAGAGTDHGAAAPVLLIGPAGAGGTRQRLVGGLHGDHPPMGTVAAPADNLVMTTDLRRVYQAVLESWLSSSDPYYERRQRALPGLFVAA